MQAMTQQRLLWKQGIGWSGLLEWLLVLSICRLWLPGSAFGSVLAFWLYLVGNIWSYDSFLCLCKLVLYVSACGCVWLGWELGPDMKPWLRLCVFLVYILCSRALGFETMIWGLWIDCAFIGGAFFQRGVSHHWRHSVCFENVRFWWHYVIVIKGGKNVFPM